MATAIINEQVDLINSALNQVNIDLDSLNTALGEMPDKIKGIPKTDGYYEQMTVGNAEQLLSNVGIEDSAPYTFRTAGGSADIGDRETDKLVGGSLAWNQLAPALAQGAYILQNASYMSDVAFGSNSLTFKVATPSGWVGFAKTNVIVQNHKYLQSCYLTAPTGIQFTSSLSNTGASGFSEANKRTLCSAVWAGTSSTTLVFYLKCQNLSVGDTVVADTPQVIDLTQMFGSTIADYIYSLEQSQAGAGVAWFRKLFPKPYYAYNAGSLIHVNASAHKMVGFNQWDEEYALGWWNYNTGVFTANNNYFACKNKIPVFPNTTYYWECPNKVRELQYYDKSGSPLGKRYSYQAGVEPTSFTTPDDCYFLTFYFGSTYGTTYNHDICINLHWDGERDGEYEPYEVHNYALDSDLVLRGIPKLDSANRLYYDGDTYESDGKVTRKYGIIDLSQITMSGGTSGTGYVWYTNLTNAKTVLNSEVAPVYHATLTPIRFNAVSSTTGTIAIRDNGTLYCNNGSNTTQPTGTVIYELATPTEEEADPYTNPQICSNWGTEEYLVTEQSGVAMPVGHDTFYPENLREKLEGLPWNFSNLIAPTEATAKATQNYAIGDYLIYNNTLYKVTSAIATGGSITVGTNVTATTIMAEIKALA